MPLGAPKPFIQMVPKWNEAFVGTDSLLTMITNSFKDPFIQKLENIFIFFIFIFCTEIYSLLKTSTNIRVIDASKIQVCLFHAHADIEGRFTSFKSALRNESIHEQKRGDRP